jgi:hypothetical protein
MPPPRVTAITSARGLRDRRMRRPLWPSTVEARAEARLLELKSDELFSPLTGTCGHSSSAPAPRRTANAARRSPAW